MTFSIDISTPEKELDELSANLFSAGKAWLEEFGRQMIDVTQKTFDALASGGTYRGVTWRQFKNMPSKKRGGASARLLDFTGALRSSVGVIFRVEENKLELGSDMPYALHQQITRPFLFFDLPADAISAARIASGFIKRSLEENNASSERK